MGVGGRGGGGGEGGGQKQPEWREHVLSVSGLQQTTPTGGAEAQMRVGGWEGGGDFLWDESHHACA